METKDLKMGLKVRTIAEFSGVPKGTIGVVESQPRSWPDAPSVAIHWQRHPGDLLID